MDKCLTTYQFYKKQMTAPTDLQVTKNTLPAEILVTIFKKLSVNDLINVSYVSKEWKKISYDDSLWQPLFTQRFRNCPNKEKETSWKKLYTNACAFYPKIDENTPIEIDTYSSFVQNPVFSASATQGLNFATCSPSGDISIKDTANNNLIQIPTGAKAKRAAIQALAIHKKIIVAGYRDGSVRAWDWSYDKPLLQKVPKCKQPVSAIAIHNTIIIMGCANGDIYKRDLSAPQKFTHLTGHNKSVLSVAIQDNIVVSGSEDKTVRVWDLKNRTSSLLEGHEGSIYAVAIQDNIIASGSADKTVRVWDRITSLRLHTLDHETAVMTVAIQEQCIVSGSNDNYIRLWDQNSGQCLRHLNSYAPAILLVDIVGRTILAFDITDSLKTWKIF
jgi:hypothetical protein